MASRILVKCLERAHLQRWRNQSGSIRRFWTVHFTARGDDTVAPFELVLSLSFWQNSYRLEVISPSFLHHHYRCLAQVICICYPLCTCCFRQRAKQWEAISSPSFLVYASASTTTTVVVLIVWCAKRAIPGFQPHWLTLDCRVCRPPTAHTHRNCELWPPN